ncbi:MAG: hypothetical protein R3320_09235 [Nitriliruptorales bacterium]|nr:hypothetical protein [Nitriliruptorales bacterium]
MDLNDDRALLRMVRQEYVYAIEMARGLHDPADDWEGFRDTLWHYLLRVFGMPFEHDHL